LGAIAQQDAHRIGKALYNDLEAVVLTHYPQVAELRQRLSAQSSLGAMMSGSGPTVFALAQTQAEAQSIATHLKTNLVDPDLELWVTQFMSHGIYLAEGGS
jgi:4-diphosphocytidyl-2-C-methyl-D-erythritol kinase